MAGLIPNAFIEDLLERVDIVAVIGQRLTLKPKGKDHWACCPFHEEKSASFSVNSVKQFYHCFGCGVGGNALTFLQEYERLSFVEAVDELARLAGVSVPKTARSAADQAVEKRKRSLYDLVASCADYYHHQLLHHPEAAQPQQYMQQRGLSDEIVQRYQLGFSPPGWQHLLPHFGGTPDTRQQLEQAGMIICKEDGRCFDRFRQRLMFPIRDMRGRTIGFGGRAFAANDKPKYLNSPETPIFHKGNELYGLYEARQALRDFDSLMIVEGYMDVLALAQHGMNNVVATLGTATSSTQIKRLLKLTDHLVFCFDGDEAGRRAALKALDQTLPEIMDGKQAHFLFLPEGEDPDSLVRQEGCEAFKARVQQALTLSDFLFQHLEQKADIRSLDGKARFANLAGEWLAKVPQGVLRQLLLQQLSKKIELPAEQLLQYLQPSHTGQLTSLPYPDDAHAPPQADEYFDGHYAETAEYGSPIFKGLGIQLSLTHRCIVWLIRYPQLASQFEVEALQKLPQQGEVALLIKVVQLLQEIPSADFYHAFDYLCQQGLREALSAITVSDYLWLSELQGDDDQDQHLASTELALLAEALLRKIPDAEYERLKQRLIIERDPSVTPEEKQRFLTLQRQRKLS